MTVCYSCIEFGVDPRCHCQRTPSIDFTDEELDVLNKILLNTMECVGILGLDELIDDESLKNKEHVVHQILDKLKNR